MLSSSTLSDTITLLPSSRISSSLSTQISLGKSSHKAGWVTPTIPLEIGVYQGDPLSVVIFNTVINTLVDTLQTRIDLGYNLSNSNHQVNLLQYADDTCILVNSPASALNVQVPYNPSEAKQSLRSTLLRMLQAVDACPLTRNQKLKMYRAGPHLSWLLMIEEYPLPWVERELEADATKFLKKWAGLARSANTALLYLPCRMGSLQGGRTSSKKHVKKLHSILRYAESSRGFTEIKQVSARSIQVCRGSMGFICLEHFCSKGRTSLHCQKVGEIPGYG